MDKVNHKAIAKRLLSLFLYLGVSVYLMMCSSDSRKSEDYYGRKMDLGKARLSSKISAPQSIFGSEKIRDRGFEGVRGFIPDYAILAKDEIKLGGRVFGRWICVTERRVWRREFGGRFGSNEWEFQGRGEIQSYRKIDFRSAGII
jgi:hypothetical protein